MKYFAYIFTLSLALNTYSAHENLGPIKYDRIRLYDGLAEQDFIPFRIVPQGEAIVMGPESPFEFILSGPLKPCIGVIIKHGEYILFVHLSSFSSPKYFGAMYRAMVAKYQLSKKIKPSVFLYSAKLDDDRFKALGYANLLSRHYEGKALTSHAELLNKLQDEIAQQLDIDKQLIHIEINQSKKIYKKFYVSESIYLSKEGILSVAVFDQDKLSLEIQRERALSLRIAAFGDDAIEKPYPPYMKESDAPPPEFFTDIFEKMGHTKKPWPTYRHECAECLRVSNEFQRCGKCKAVYYCSRQCQRANWKGHKKACKKMRH